MIADLTVWGETLPTRYVVFMILILVLLAFEVRAWVRMDRREREEDGQQGEGD